MRKLAVVILLVIMLCLSVCGCDEPTPVPVATPAPAPASDEPSLAELMADAGIIDVQPAAEDIAGSRATLEAAASAAESLDNVAFLGTLSDKYRTNIGSFDLARGDANTLASALRNARLSESNRYSMTYETTVEGRTFQIFLVLEDGVWKIDAM